MTATPSLPWPKISSSSGAIATSGTERSSIAIGMNANSNGLNEHEQRGDHAADDQPGDEADRRVARVRARPRAAASEPRPRSATRPYGARRGVGEQVAARRPAASCPTNARHVERPAAARPRAPPGRPARPRRRAATRRAGAARRPRRRRRRRGATGRWTVGDRASRDASGVARRPGRHQPADQPDQRVARGPRPAPDTSARNPSAARRSCSARRSGRGRGRGRRRCRGTRR